MEHFQTGFGSDHRHLKGWWHLVQSPSESYLYVHIKYSTHMIFITPHIQYEHVMFYFSDIGAELVKKYALAVDLINALYN